MKFTETDTKLIQLIKRRNLSFQREKEYNIVFKEIYQLFDKTPTQLIKEARAEQQPFIDDKGNPRILELDERKVNNYQFYFVISIIYFCFFKCYVDLYQIDSKNLSMILTVSSSCFSLEMVALLSPS